MNIVIEEKSIQELPVNIDPEIMSGTPVFEGTRVPIDALTNNLADGVSLDEFLEDFPTVSRDQALAILKFSHETLLKIIQREYAKSNFANRQGRQRLPRAIGPLDRSRRLMVESEIRQRK